MLERMGETFGRIFNRDKNGAHGDTENPPIDDTDQMIGYLFQPEIPSTDPTQANAPEIIVSENQQVVIIDFEGSYDTSILPTSEALFPGITRKQDPPPPEDPIRLYID